MTDAIDPHLDLVFERRTAARPALVWRAWTEPEHVVKWFTPAPWVTTACEIDLRPGGVFRTTMRSPDGQEHPNIGCYLLIEPPGRLVWTTALGPAFRPAPGTPGMPAVTIDLSFKPDGTGTRYTAIARHQSPGDRQTHDAMGFQDGWGKAFEQLVDVLRTL